MRRKQCAYGASTARRLRQAVFQPLLVIVVAIFRPAVAQDLHIEHVAVVSPEVSRALNNAEVWVHDGWITAISTSPRLKAGPERAAGTQTLDGRGLYLIPGLIDGHVHLGDFPGMTPEQEQAHPEIALPARAVSAQLLVFWFHHAH